MEKYKGIYAYLDSKNNNKIIYIGKDSYMWRKNRHYDHIAPCNYNQQQINRVLQNNPTRYVYVELKRVNHNTSNEELNELEKKLIKHHNNPLFNFTDGGEGANGYKHTKEALEKISKANIGNKKRLGIPHKEEDKKKISENHSHYWKNKTFSEEHKRKLSESKTNKYCGENNHNWKNYPRIIKHGFTTKKNRIYALKINGKVIKQSIYLEKLFAYACDELSKTF